MRLPYTLAFAASASAAAAAWDCKIDKYDLTPLGGVKRVAHDLDTPPSTTRRIVRLNLCDVLGKEDKIADEDQVSCSPLPQLTDSARETCRRACRLSA